MEAQGKPRVLIVTDFIPPAGWFLPDHLRLAGYVVKTIGTTDRLLHASTSYLNLVRWGGWFSLAYRSFRRRRAFDVILFWNPVVGLLSSCLFRLASADTKRIMIFNLIFHRKNWLQDTLRIQIYRFAFQRVDFLAVGSEEIGLYYERLFGFPHTRTGLIPECVGRDQFEEIPPENLEDYVFAGGAANRDWKTFFDAMRKVSAPAVAVSWKHSFDGLEVPDNVTLRYNLPVEVFHQVHRKSKIVVIPLQDPLMISGMEVLDRAMALGKAIIATRTSVTAKHLEDGRTGLLVAPGDAGQLASRINYLLENPDIAEKLGRQAQQCARETLTPEQGAEQIRLMIDAVYHGARRESRR